MGVGDIIRVERERKGLSQAELARRLGVSQQIVSHWENNSHLPRISSIQRILGILDIKLEQILGPEPVERSADDLDPQLVSTWKRLTPEARKKLVKIAGVLSEASA